MGMRMNEGAVRMGDNSFSHSSPLAIRWDCFYIFYNFQNCFLQSPKVIPSITRPHNNNFQILISSLENPPLNSFFCQFDRVIKEILILLSWSWALVNKFIRQGQIWRTLVLKITFYVKETDFPPGPILKLYSKILQEASSRVREAIV